MARLLASLSSRIRRAGVTEKRCPNCLSILVQRYYLVVRTCRLGVYSQTAYTRWVAWRQARREARRQDAWPAPPAVPDWVMSAALLALVAVATWWGVGVAVIVSWLMGR